jgi:hypothetical protein
MVTAIVFLGIGVIGGVMLGWYLGYHVGNLDGQEGIRACWPWSKDERVN